MDALLANFKNPENLIDWTGGLLMQLTKTLVEPALLPVMAENLACKKHQLGCTTHSGD